MICIQHVSSEQNNIEILFGLLPTLNKIVLAFTIKRLVVAPAVRGCTNFSPVPLYDHLTLFLELFPYSLSWLPTLSLYCTIQTALLQTPGQGSESAVIDVVVDPHISQHLRPHQREGINFLYECIMGYRGLSGLGAILA